MMQMKMKTQAVQWMMIAFTATLSFHSCQAVDSSSGRQQTHGVQMQDVQDNIAFVRVAEELLPSVVSIFTTRRVAENGSSLRDFFEDFFGRGMPGQQQPRQERQMQGLGSGVIVDADGYILTNYHVIEGADDIQVELYDQRRFEGELVGADPLTELAVIQIKGNDLPAAKLGHSDALRIGEWVLAIGNPLRLYSTVTAGIVSGKSRALGIIRDPDAGETGGSYAIENFIQTDAAINPGNSGGALVNLKSEVIGINTAIASQTGGYQGYGFAVPIDLAKKIMKDLIEHGEVTRPWIGISMRAVTPAIAKRFDMDKPRGVLVDRVMAESPAEKAGLKTLDIILAVDDEPVNQANQVQNAVLLKNPGDALELHVYREGETKTVIVTLGKRQPQNGAGRNQQQPASPIYLGMTVERLTDSMRSRLRHNAYEGITGLLVTRVERGKAAYNANIRPGDLITRVEDQNVDTIEDYRHALAQYEPGDVLIFSIMRRYNALHAFVTLPGKDE